MVITEIANQDPFQMTLVQYNNMVQTISPDAADHSFNVSSLPRASRSRQDLFDTHAADAFPKLAPINSIAIPN